MKLLVTRPEPDAGTLAALLERQGHSAVIAPLLAVENIPGSVPPLDEITALIFTSANGVRAFLAADPHRDLPCYAVGDRTAAALREGGFDRVESAAGDVESLVTLIAAQRQSGDGTLLHIAGSEVAGDLAGDLERAGFKVARAVLYRTTPRALSEESIAAIRNGGIDGVLLFSPRTAAAFAESIRGTGLAENLRNATAWCLSQAVAAALGGLPFARIEHPPIPTQEALLALLNAPAADAAPAPSAPDANPRRRRYWLYPAVAVVALIAGGVTSPFWMPASWLEKHGWLHPPPPEPRELSLMALPNSPGTAPVIIHTSDPRIEGLSQGMITLQRKLAALEAKPVVDTTGLDQVIADEKMLGASVASLEARLDAIDARLHAAEGESAANHALLLAAEDLRQDLMSSAPYQGPFSVLQTLGGKNPQVAALLQPLAAGAAAGIPSRVLLSQQLASLIQTLDAPPSLPETMPWWRRLLDRLEHLVVIRHVTAEAAANDPQTVAKLAAEDLDQGDLAGAIDRMAAITRPGAAQAAPWLNAAKQRLAAEQAASQLTTLLSAQLAAPTPLGTHP